MRLKPLKQDKGVAGLNILLSVIIMLFTIGLLIMIFAIIGAEVESETYDATTVSFTDTATSGVVNTTGVPVGSYKEPAYRDCSLTITTAVNGSGGNVIHSANWTITGCIITNATAELVNDENWYINGSITYNANSSASQAIWDTAHEITQVTDWFGIIIVITAMVVLILLTVIIIQTIKGSGMVAMGEGGVSRDTA